MVEAYVDGELDEPTARAVRVHLRECWWCSADAETHRLVRATLRRRRDRTPPLAVARLRRFVRGLDQE
jgi:anti-sigma factor RsiW